jgi:O-antigen ligase
MKFLLAGLFGLVSLPILGLFIARPSRTVLPLYAGTLPIASVVQLSIPLPPPFNTLSSMLGALTIGAGLAHVILYRRGRIPTVPVAMWLIFLAWAIGTTLWALEVDDALETIVVAVPLLLLMVIVSFMHVDEEDFDILKVALIVGSAVVGMYASYLLLSGRALPSHGVSERFSVTSNPDATNPNILAASLLLPLALAVQCMVFGGSRWWKKRTWRLLGVVGMVFTVIAIVLTSSRGGMLAAFAVIVVCLLYSARERVNRPGVLRTTGAVIASALAFGAFVSISLAVSPRGAVREIFSSGPFERIAERQTDSSGRLEIWTAGRLACETYCAQGAGFGNFPNAYSEVFALSGASENVGANRPAHNVYLSLVVETGFLGLTLLGLALLAEWVALSSFSMRPVEPALKAALVGLLIASIFLSAIWFKYFWLVFAVIRAAESATSRQEATRPPTPTPALST